MSWKPDPGDILMMSLGLLIAIVWALCIVAWVL